MNNKTLSQELAWRGFTNQTTFSSATELDKEPITFYFGVDPSATSMTIGNLAATMMVRHFIAHGHSAVLLIGGATGMIGDPDGKAQERSLKTIEEVQKNKAGIVGQYKSLFAGNDFTVVDNYDWFKDMNYIDFLRKVGKHVPMRQMLGRDFIQSRLGEDGVGISYAEFSYVLIQAYDFLHLNETMDVSLQICGSDQWGNSIAGVDLVRRVSGKEAHVWSTPLVINKSTGKKFGKSEDGAIWLDPKLTSPYKFYQFWLNVDDEGVEDYLKIYTLLDEQQITSIMIEFQTDRANRLAQKTLAKEVTVLVHGEQIAESVKRVSEVLFGSSDYQTLQLEDFNLIKSELPFLKIQNNQDIAGVLVESKLASSNGEARRFILSNAIYVNGKQINADTLTLTSKDAIMGYILLRRGKNAQVVLEV